MIFSNDHLVSLTLSAAVHLVGLLLLGDAARRPLDAPADAVPEETMASTAGTPGQAQP